MGRYFLQKLFSAYVGNGLFCPSEDFPYLLQAGICAGKQAEVDKAVFSLNGNSGFHGIEIGRINIDEISGYNLRSIQKGKIALKMGCRPRLDRLAVAVLL